MFIKVGTLVLCHLIVPNQSGTQTADEARKIIQVPGIVKEITEKDDIQMVGNSYAVKMKKYMFLIEPTTKDQLFTIGSDACRPVLSEEEHLQIAARKEKERKKREAAKTAEQRQAEKDAKEAKEQELHPKDPINRAINKVNDAMEPTPSPTPEPLVEKPVPVSNDEPKATGSDDKEKEDLLKQLDK